MLMLIGLKLHIYRGRNIQFIRAGLNIISMLILIPFKLSKHCENINLGINKSLDSAQQVTMKNHMRR